MRTRNAVIVAIAAFLIMGGCVHRPALSPAALNQAYLAAVRDAEEATPAEISRNLVALVASNPDLIRNEAGEIRVVTWTDWKGYDTQVGQRLTLSRDVWITVVPHVRSFCHACGLSDAALDLRLRQRLGLPPDDAKTRFVEFWVSPDNLFRPSPDPEISDHEAEVDFPRPQRFVTVSPDHKEWFEALKKSSYGDQGYPWTRLGYTYDWGGKTEVGESEFVIPKGSEVWVHSVTPTQAYCTDQTP